MGRKRLLTSVILSFGLGVASLGALATPAGAGPGDTNTTFTLSGGSLAISVPASANLGSAATGSLTLSGHLGSMTVTDTRGALVATWTATVASTNFTTGGASANETVSKTNVAYLSGVSSATSGTGSFVAGLVPSLVTSGTAGAWASGAGNNSATWDPTLTLTLLGSQVAGLYSGTITHSVA
jgi:hypothetical protein